MSSPAPQPNFDRVAFIYRWVEYLALGPLLQRVRMQHLPKLTTQKSALVLGDGDGRFLARLLASNVHIQALAIDSSARMLSLLQKRCAFAADRLRTQQASALVISPPSKTDLIVTHFLLDCFSQKEVDTLARRVASSCSPGTLWLVSDFDVPRKEPMKSFARVYIRMLYFAFGILTGLKVHRLPDPRKALSETGFTRVVGHSWLGGILYSELWQLGESR